MFSLSTSKSRIFSGLILFGFLTAGSVAACPASYVKQKAEDNQGTALYDKSSQIADKYMTNRGINPLSPAGEITRPYVIGTALVEHDNNNALKGTSSWVAEERIDLNEDTVDEIVTKVLGTFADQPGVANSDTGGHSFIPCYDHFNRHFGNGIHIGGDLPTQLDSDAQAG